VIGIVGFTAGATLDAIQLISTIAGGLVSLLWAIVVVRMALKKQYGEFRLALVPR